MPNANCQWFIAAFEVTHWISQASDNPGRRLELLFIYYRTERLATRFEYKPPLSIQSIAGRGSLIDYHAIPKNENSYWFRAPIMVSKILLIFQ